MRVGVEADVDAAAAKAEGEDLSLRLARLDIGRQRSTVGEGGARESGVVNIVADLQLQNAGLDVESSTTRIGNSRSQG